MSSDGPNGGYVLNFDSEHHEFGRGFEAGLVWAHAFHSGGINALVHATNAEMVLRICETLNMRWQVFEVEDHEDLIHIVLGDALDTGYEDGDDPDAEDPAPGDD